MASEKEAFIDKKQYSAKVLFSYSTSHLKQKDKIRFYYALKGRDGKSGIVKQYRIEQLGRLVFIADKKSAKDAEDFLKLWSCRYSMKEVLVKR